VADQGKVADASLMLSTATPITNEDSRRVRFQLACEGFPDRVSPAVT